MPRTKISEFSSTPANNTDIDSINISEGCAPSGINDAIRELMSQLKDWQSGTSNDPMVIGSSGSLTLNQGTANGVTYLNGSKVVTSGSALTFNGTSLTIDGGTAGYLYGPAGELMIGEDASGLYIGNGGGGVPAIPILFGSTATTYQRFNAGGSEQMRLTSTGLGIGTSSPVNKLVVSNAGANGLEVAPVGTNGGTNISSLNRSTSSFTTFNYYANDHRFYYGASNTEGLRLDSSGNLGLGVTPSAWGSQVKPIQIGNAGGQISAANTSFSGSNWLWVGNNSYLDSSYNHIYSRTAAASLYQQNAGIHAWYNAPSGTAGNAITFTQAATLTANGNYLVGTTTENSGSGGLKVAGQFAVTSSQAFTSSGTVNSTAFYVVCYSLSGTCTLTLPTPSTNVGRVLKIVTQSNQAIVSASSNVTAIASGGLTTSILPATAGKWAELWCDGSYWAIIGTNA